MSGMPCRISRYSNRSGWTTRSVWCSVGVTTGCGAAGRSCADPATGSACANLGGWHIATGKPLPFTATLFQGEAVKRPSRLRLRVDADQAIYVSGSVIRLGEGEVDI